MKGGEGNEGRVGMHQESQSWRKGRIGEETHGNRVTNCNCCSESRVINAAENGLNNRAEESKTVPGPGLGNGTFAVGSPTESQKKRILRACIAA